MVETGCAVSAFRDCEDCRDCLHFLFDCTDGKTDTDAQSDRGLLGIGGVLGATAYLATDNLSTGIIICGITWILVAMASPYTRYFVAITAVMFVLLVILVQILKFSIDTAESGSFRVQRVLVWLHPEQNSDAGGYQVMQALYAIGSGGFFGKGLGNSVQKLGSVPEAQNDMIFSIVCEELGIFGGALVLLLFAYLLYRLFFYQPECAGFVRVFVGSWNYDTYCFAGDFKTSAW